MLTAGRWSLWPFASAMALAAAAMLSKEQGITVLGACIVLDVALSVQSTVCISREFGCNPAFLVWGLLELLVGPAALPAREGEPALL